MLSEVSEPPEPRISMHKNHLENLLECRVQIGKKKKNRVQRPVQRSEFTGLGHGAQDSAF